MTQEQDGFLSRWSRRKLDADEAEQQAEETRPEQDAAPDISEPEAASQAEEKPIWQRDDVDADTKKAALRKLFHKPEFNLRDGLNEYDDDFTQFAGLGSVVTHEMKRMLKLAEENTRPSEQTPAKEAKTEQDNSQSNRDKEDNDLA
ncbi:DUF3306 domain-containing protein [uncultured Methylophaga sp.]|uniref:DUF3306 domain-containing protein n=1 Tax=uncultured Methylophaga sp. TaxID=285271 RepID=UPI0026216082|nr:DUF3306 domain-containing protein [uncultured Methylophaga sp.]